MGGGGGDGGGVAEDATAYHTESQNETKQLTLSSLFSFLCSSTLLPMYISRKESAFILNHDFNFI